ncbi:hypothetical protein CE195_04030, partial [Sodalis-like symbiont of Philaenus spumarius]
GKHIVLGVSGGIAAYKAPELVRRLRDSLLSQLHSSGCINYQQSLGLWHRSVRWRFAAVRLLRSEWAARRVMIKCP